MKVISLVLVFVMMFPASFAITASAAVGGESAEDEFRYLSFEELQQLSQEELANYCREFCRHEFQGDSLAFNKKYNGGIQPFWSSDPSKTGDFSTYDATHAYITAFSLLLTYLQYNSHFGHFKLSDSEMILLYKGSEEPDYHPFSTEVGYAKTYHFYNSQIASNAKSTAKYAFRHFMNLATSEMKRGNRNSAIYHLGFALHFIQDVCEPHHARDLATVGHAKFENWVANNFENLDVSESMQKLQSKEFTKMLNTSTDQLLTSAALSGYNAYESGSSESTYMKMANSTVGNAVTYTLLAIYYFELHT